MFFQKCCFRGAATIGQIAVRQMAVSQKFGVFKSALQFGEAKTSKLPSKCHLVD
jgi:hypothetical protein